MLTDYHVHLRPDDPRTFAAEYFLSGNAARYRETATGRGGDALGASAHIPRSTAAPDVWQHRSWGQKAVDALDRYVGFVRAETALGVGVEAASVRRREDRMAGLLEGTESD